MNPAIGFKIFIAFVGRQPNDPKKAMGTIVLHYSTYVNTSTSTCFRQICFCGSTDETWEWALL